MTAVAFGGQEGGPQAGLPPALRAIFVGLLPEGEAILHLRYVAFQFSARAGRSENAIDWLRQPGKTHLPGSFGDPYSSHQRRRT